LNYYSLNAFLTKKFGYKVAKLSLNAGFTCPNRDGTLSYNGCIFCSEKGSGDFSDSPNETITQQIKNQKKIIERKWKNTKYIAYFQAFTNTYAECEYLKKVYYEALSAPDICGIAIATRPDCLNDEVIALLLELAKKTYVWVELGLQTSNEKSAQFINRGYNNEVFINAVNRLRKANIDVVTHVILGLPFETKEQILDTIKWSTSMDIQGIKLHLLHVLKNTQLEKIYEDTPFYIPSMDEYIDLVCEVLKIVPKHIVIHRLTGDGPKKDLIAPLWSGDKKLVLNTLNNKIVKENIQQGIKAIEKVSTI